MIRVLIVAPVRFYREGLEQVLGSEPTMTVVATAADLSPLDAWVALAPDTALIDLRSPEGPEAVHALLAAMPTLRVVALAVPHVEAELIAWAEAGVAGFLPPDGSIEDVMAAIEGVVVGDSPCSAWAAGALLRRVASLAATGRPQPANSRLTSRELEILRLLDRGLSNKEIAGRLCIALPTVKNHIHNILEKLHVHRRQDAVTACRGRLATTTPVA